MGVEIPEVSRWLLGKEFSLLLLFSMLSREGRRLFASTAILQVQKRRSSPTQGVRMER